MSVFLSLRARVCVCVCEMASTSDASTLWFDDILTDEERHRRSVQARVRKTDSMCKFWVTGYCRYGDACKNRHVYHESKMELCEYFQSGACKKSEVQTLFLGAPKRKARCGIRFSVVVLGGNGGGVGFFFSVCTGMQRSRRETRQLKCANGTRKATAETDRPAKRNTSNSRRVRPSCLGFASTDPTARSHSTLSIHTLRLCVCVCVCTRVPLALALVPSLLFCSVFVFLLTGSRATTCNGGARAGVGF